MIVDLIWLNEDFHVILEAHRTLQFLLTENPDPLAFEPCFKAGEISGFEDQEESHHDPHEHEKRSTRSRRHAYQAKSVRRNELIEGDFWNLIEHLTSSLEWNTTPLQVSY